MFVNSLEISNQISEATDKTVKNKLTGNSAGLIIAAIGSAQAGRRRMRRRRFIR